MKINSYSSRSTVFDITLILITLFSNCKQSLQMQSYDEKEVSTTNIEDYYSNTELLFEVVRVGNKERIKELLLNNPDVNVKDKYGRTPLHWAAEKGNKDIAELLIDSKLDVNVKSKGGIHRCIELFCMVKQK